ncbi:hypothetical protein [Chryseobacterium sp. MMS23-Vi53]|uniref:hypothetical protein n=1 Tax=Chryseobacterium sp. MMS23-Vi53 TaxID=3386644 RepID=UPI0039E7D70F
MLNKKNYFILFLFLFTTFNAQITKLSYDRSFNYSIKENNNFTIYTNQIPTDNLIISYGESWDISYKKHFDWQHSNNHLNGDLLNNKFLNQHGSTTLSPLLEINLVKDENLYDIDSFKNCIAYKGFYKDGSDSYIMIYCTEDNDNHDYSKMNNFLLKTMFGLDSANLPTNNIIVKLMMFNGKGEVIFNLVDLLNISNEKKEIYFNKDYVNSYINGQKPPKDRKDKPYYCQFTIEEFYLSDELEKRLNEFMCDMDTYFNEFGYLNSKDQSDFYDSEIERLSIFYKKYKHLNQKQIDKFKLTLKKLKTSKKEEDFFWIRDAY